MDKIFITQIITSCLVGGTVAAFFSFLAERSSEKIAGIILMIPSTIALGFFFLGWATSAEKVAEVIPASLIPLGIFLLSVVTYIYTATFLARKKFSRLQQIIFSFLIANIIWLILALPFAITKFSNLPIAIITYIIIALISHILLHHKREHPNHIKQKYSIFGKIIRALAMGSLIAIIVFLGKTFNHFWGGIFTMYPAVTLSTLVFFHIYHQPQELFSLMKKAPVGSVLLVIYSLTVMLMFPKFELIFGTIIAYAINFLFLALFLILSRQNLGSKSC